MKMEDKIEKFREFIKESIRWKVGVTIWGEGCSGSQGLCFFTHDYSEALALKLMLQKSCEDSKVECGNEVKQRTFEVDIEPIEIDFDILDSD